MKKIIFIAQTLNRGGAERVVSLLSQEFERIGYKVKIILFDNKIQYKYGGEIININTPASSSYIIKLVRIYQRIKKLKKKFKNEKPDYIFSFMESCNFASILTGEEVVVSVRNNPNKKHNWYQKILIKSLYKFKNVKKIVAVSKEIENILNQDYSLKNTATILNPIIIDNNYKIKENLSKYQPYIVSVGRLNTQKNFEMLIRAYSKTNTQEKTKLLIVGEGSERIKLEQLIKSLKLENKVLLIGQRENIKDYYLQSEIYILSSSFEGFPNVLVEALSNNCACIATNCPTGPNEIIINEKNGLLIENENQEEMSKVIDKLYIDEDLKNKLKDNSIKLIEHLKLEKIAKSWIEIC
jgi:GalNAc-alpha-(1->4)-GalNAc-alpha-(1->3)-diNAcBac-PP-undecaprenol alpha-1,4-N-acetyl-D-galactosaminyltransferase